MGADRSVVGPPSYQLKVFGNIELKGMMSYLKFSFLRTILKGMGEEGSLKILILRNFPHMRLVSTLN